jgi:lincosamide nucleotidyltransferase A/C/D/E
MKLRGISSTGIENMQETFMTSKDVLDLYAELENLNIKIWLDGGWSVDALLSKQLRPHKDIDIAIEWKDVPKLREFLATKGYHQLKEGEQWNFVLEDNQGRKVDVHVFRFDRKGNVVEGIMYPPESLTGMGVIEGMPVRCIGPKYMVAFLAPWLAKWPEKYEPAIASLCAKFDIELPKEYVEFKNGQKR